MHLYGPKASAVAELKIRAFVVEENALHLSLGVVPIAIGGD